MAVITISRQFGSGGDEIAAQVCEILAYHYFDKRLMAQVASEIGIAEAEIIDFSEDTYRLQGFLDRLFGRRRGTHAVTQAQTLQAEVAGPQVKEVEKLDEAYSISLIQSTIFAAYQRGNVVIVGRGGQAILKDKHDVLHVRIGAPYKARVQRLHDRENYGWGGAKDAAIKHDRASAEYLKRFYDIDWADPALYDLVINTAKLGTSAAASLVVSALGHLTPSVPSDEEAPLLSEKP